MSHLLLVLALIVAQPEKDPLDLTNPAVKKEFDFLPEKDQKALLAANDLLKKGPWTPPAKGAFPGKEFHAMVRHVGLFDGRAIVWIDKAGGHLGGDELIKIVQHPEAKHRKVRLSYAEAYVQGDSYLGRGALLRNQVLKLAERLQAGGLNSLKDEEKNTVSRHRLLFNLD